MIVKKNRKRKRSFAGVKIHIWQRGIHSLVKGLKTKKEIKGIYQPAVHEKG